MKKCKTDTDAVFFRRAYSVGHGTGPDHWDLQLRA